MGDHAVVSELHPSQIMGRISLLTEVNLSYLSFHLRLAIWVILTDV